jgi:hypothetical protein
MLLASVIIVVAVGDELLPLVLVALAGALGSRLSNPAMSGALLAGCALRNMVPPAFGTPSAALSDIVSTVLQGLVFVRAGLTLEVCRAAQNTPPC